MTMGTPILKPGDREWVTVGEALKAAGIEPGQKVRFAGMLTHEEWKLREQIKNSQFFLVRNGHGDGFDTVEPMPCDKCGAGRYPTKPHPYLTWMCVECPFRGLDSALFALSVKRGDAVMERAVLQWQDFALLHPFTARAYGDPYSETLLSFAIGTAVPIDERAAKRYADAINGKRPPTPFVL